MSSAFETGGLVDSGISDVRRAQVAQQGKILGIVHVVLGVLTALFGLIFLIYVGMGAMMMTGNFGPPNSGPDSAIIGGIFIAIGLFAILFCLGIGALQIYAGMSFMRFKNHTFLIVVQVLNLLNQPLGLILGVFGLLFLLNADAKAIFDEVKRGGEPDPDLLS